MEENINKLHYLEKDFNQKMQKRYQFDLFERLMRKLQNEHDEKVIEITSNMIYQLEQIKHDDKISSKRYHQLFREVKKHVKNTYGYVEKGSVQGEYMALGIGFGLAFGSVFTLVNTAFIGIGLPIGIAVGLAIGASKEKELEKENKLY